MVKIFEPKITNLKHKSIKDRPDIYARLASNLEFRDLESESAIPLTLPYKLKCEHPKAREIHDYDLGAVICGHCHEWLDQIYINHDKDDHIKQAHNVIWERTYDRNKWKNYGLQTMNGENNEKLSDQIWYDILKDIPNPFTWHQVYKVFQTHSCKDYWTAFGSYIGLPNPLNHKILTYVDKYINHARTKYRVNYMYFAFKFVQMFKPGEEKYIPIKQSKKWMADTDEWWREVCESDGLHFEASGDPVKIQWNKDKIVQDLGLYLRLAGMEKIVVYHEKDSVQVETIKLWSAKYKQYCLKSQQVGVKRVTGSKNSAK